MTRHGFAVEEWGWALKHRCYLRKKKRLEEWPGGGRLLSVTPPRPLAKCGHKPGRPNYDDGPAEATRASCFQARFMRTFTSYNSMFCRPATVGASSASTNCPVVTTEDTYMAYNCCTEVFHFPQPNRLANNKNQIEATSHPCPHSGSDLICRKTHFSRSWSFCGRPGCWRLDLRA